MVTSSTRGDWVLEDCLTVAMPLGEGAVHTRKRERERDEERERERERERCIIIVNFLQSEALETILTSNALTYQLLWAQGSFALEWIQSEGQNSVLYEMVW